MSGTRKMEKFDALRDPRPGELDAHVDEHGREKSESGPAARARVEAPTDPVEVAASPGEWIPPLLEETAPLALTTKRENLASDDPQWDDADAPVVANGPAPFRDMQDLLPESSDVPHVPPFPVEEIHASLRLPLVEEPAREEEKEEERPVPAKSGRTIRGEPPASERRAHVPLRAPAKSDPGKVEQGPTVEIAGAKKTPDDLEALRTRLARKFVTLADQVTEAFGEFAIGAGAWAVELTAPQGMSTGGGKQALQHLRLRPRRNGFPVILGGTVNHIDKVAELRDYEHAALTHQVRFKTVLDITPQEWEQFLRKAEVVLANAQVKVTRTPPDKELVAQSKAMSRVSPKAIAALVVVAILAGLVLWRVIVALSAAPAG